MRFWGKLSRGEKRAAIQAYEAGENKREIADRYDISQQNRGTFYRKLRDGVFYAKLFVDAPKETQTGSQLCDDIARLIKNNPLTLSQLSKRLDRSETSVRQAVKELELQGYNITTTMRSVCLDTLSTPSVPTTTLDLDTMCICLAIASDLHAGSTCQQITATMAFEKYAVEQGAQAFLHPGDLFAGYGVYRGQVQDLYATSAEEQVRALNSILPDWGIPRLALGGNHDASFLKANGFDPVRYLCSMRSDMRYLGYDAADVALTDRVDVRLTHPSGSQPYALSYRLQKGMENTAYDELQQAIDAERSPNLRVVIAGHLHAEVKMRRGPVIGIQAPCFEGQTNYLKAKGLYPQIGGQLLWLWLTDSGMIAKERYEYVPFQEVHNDWLNHRERWEMQEPSHEPLFSWEA